MTSLWHEGGVASAIAAVRSKHSLLVVHSAYVDSGDAGSDAGGNDEPFKILSRSATKVLERVTFKSSIVRRAVVRHNAVCVQLRATADDEDYVNFSALFTVDNAPCLHIIAPDGRVLLKREFYISPEGLVHALDYAAALRDNVSPAPAVPDLGPELHEPRPLEQHVLDDLAARAQAARDAEKKAKAALEAKQKAKESAAKRADVGSTSGAMSKAGSTATTTSAGVVERTSTVTRELPESRGALQLGARARLQVRLPSGANATRSFDCNATLDDVMKWACTEAGVESLQLSVTFPRRVFDAGDKTKTLSELGLAPSATLICTNISGGDTSSGASAGAGAGGGVVSAGGALLRGAVGVAGSFFGSFVGGGPPANHGHPTQGSGEDETERNGR